MFLHLVEPIKLNRLIANLVKKVYTYPVHKEINLTFKNYVYPFKTPGGKWIGDELDLYYPIFMTIKVNQ